MSAPGAGQGIDKFVALIGNGTGISVPAYSSQALASQRDRKPLASAERCEFRVGAIFPVAEDGTVWNFGKVSMGVSQTGRVLMSSAHTLAVCEAQGASVHHDEHSFPPPRLFLHRLDGAGLTRDQDDTVSRIRCQTMRTRLSRP